MKVLKGLIFLLFGYHLRIGSKVKFTIPKVISDKSWRVRVNGLKGYKRVDDARRGLCVTGSQGMPVSWYPGIVSATGACSDNTGPYTNITMAPPHSPPPLSVFFTQTITTIDNKRRYPLYCFSAFQTLETGWDKANNNNFPSQNDLNNSLFSLICFCPLFDWWGSCASDNWAECEQ